MRTSCSGVALRCRSDGACVRWLARMASAASRTTGRDLG
ncbi:hypothetical protein PCLA_07f0296 [Pseudomonas citronellolis]|nr:hypothetical protein PCLA_07f0296 [Pseudomonas citronellolis]